KASGVLIEILQQVQLRLRNVQPLPRQDVGLLRLVEVVLAGKNGKPELDRPIEQIRLREPQLDHPAAVAQSGAEAERLTQAKKVIGLVIEPDKGPCQAAYAAVHPDRVLLLFPDLQCQVDG